MNKKQIERFIREARNEDSISVHSIEKHCFESLLCGLKIKLLGKKGEAEKQLSTICRMENFLEMMTFRNCISIFQAKIIISQDRQISILQQEKSTLIEENISLKKNIK